jgi:hypothetical protein
LIYTENDKLPEQRVNADKTNEAADKAQKFPVIVRNFRADLQYWQFVLVRVYR